MRRDRRRVARLVALLLSLTALAGCASMPDGGPVAGLSLDSSDQTQGSQVTVFALGPRAGAGPSAIVSGFLEALTSDDPGFAVARQYLTQDAVGQWDAGAGLTVLDTFTSTLYPEDNNLSQSAQVTLSGTKVATVSPEGAYSPVDQPTRLAFSLTQTPHGQWRISGLPSGLVLTRLDFQRIYHPFNLYYLNPLDQDRGLIGDPVFLRDGEDNAASLAAALVRGPTNSLAGAVDTAFPDGTVLTSRNLPIRDGQIQVPLSDIAATASPTQRRAMAVQLTWTMSQLSGVTGAAASARGTTIAFGSKTTMAGFDPAAGYGNTAYFERNGRLYLFVAGEQGSGQPALAPGPLSAQPATSQLPGWGAFAVSLDSREPSVAAISGDGGRLGVSTMRDGARMQTWLTQPELSSPTWDALGDLWVLSRPRPDVARQVWLLRAGQQPTLVTLADPTVRIEAIRVARDGTRIAAVVDAGASGTSGAHPATRELRVGRVQRSPGGNAAPVIVNLTPIAPTLADVGAVRWYGPDKLAVLGQQPNGGLQPELFDVDGSHETPLGAPQGNLSQLAASGPDQPLLASTDQNHGTIWQLGQTSSGSTNWTKVAEGGFPVYPG